MAGVDEVFAERPGALAERNGRLYLARPDGEGDVAVTVRYLRPLTSRSEIAFLDEKGREVATVRSVEALTPEQRALVEQALRERYHLVRITTVREIDTRFGTRYWMVDTDRGPRWFALREPGKNVSWLDDRHLVMRDTAGNRYEIPDLRALDARSQRWVQTNL